MASSARASLSAKRPPSLAFRAEVLISCPSLCVLNVPSHLQVWASGADEGTNAGEHSLVQNLRRTHSSVTFPYFLPSRGSWLARYLTVFSDKHFSQQACRGKRLLRSRHIS